MSCNCQSCERFIKATSVAITTPTTGENYITITVPNTVTFTDGCWCIGLFTTIPNTIQCARIVVTNGTDEINILQNDGNYWRPCQLRCRTVLKLQHLSDPEHFLIRKVRR
jgi:hypothetical protein